ncbi:MAG: MCE family protein [candidate division Zixibacteria bacterium]|nr:MCE family protein [candidate division Zixibacteria bacterium]
MKNKSIELQVGIVIFLAIIILGYGILWLKEYRFNIERYSYAVYFPETGSLDIGDPVAVLGVDKGEVEDIVLKSGNRVLVTFNLTKDVVLKSDTEFTIMNIGLMGERFIQVKPGYSDSLLDLSSPVSGYYDTGIPEVMGMLGRGIDEMRELIRILTGTIGTEQASTDIKTIISNMLKITQKTKTLLDSTGGELTSAVNNLSYSSAKLKTIIDSNEHKLQNTITNFDSASTEFVKLTKDLTKISKDLKVITTKLNSDDNTVGLLLKDRKLYDQLNSTAVNLDSLIIDIKKNPKKYIHLEIF